jgi:D-glycero-D-manno-heptose 1,7-bisphosphate phosphatase
MSVPRRRAVFLDRDGTINVDHGYVCRAEEFEIIPGAPEAIRRLRDAGFQVIVVTNQAGIARGYYGETELHALHSHLDRELERSGTAIDAYYYCPHHPEQGIGPFRRDCDCRKPLPGMLRQAATDRAIDLEGSYLVGDKLSDILAGLAAGCAPILVLTGYGAGVEIVPPEVPRVADLAAAADLILSKQTPHSLDPERS